MLSAKFDNMISSRTVEQCFIDSCTKGDIVFLEDLLAIPYMRNRAKKEGMIHFEGLYAGFVSAYEQRRRKDCEEAFKSYFFYGSEECTFDVDSPAFLTVACK